MYPSSVSKELKDEILSNLYMLIGRSICQGLYPLKGGYVLSKKVGGKVRRTSDIDIFVLNEDTFALAISSVKGYLNELKRNGLIWDYDVKMPKIVDGKNVSGGVKLYTKLNGNSRKRLLCGIDISIHPVRLGVELSADGFCQYSNELMIADKISVLYSSESSIMRRIRDIVDIYLLSYICDKKKFNGYMVLGWLKYKGVNISRISTLELMLSENPDKVYRKVEELLASGKRVDSSLLSSFNTSIKEIVRTSTSLLAYLRRL